MKSRLKENLKANRIYLNRSINFFHLKKTDEPEGVYYYPQGKRYCFEGHIGSLTEWARATESNVNTVRSRIRSGSSLEDALFEYLIPVPAPNIKDKGLHFESNWSERYLKLNHKFLSLTELAQRIGIKRTTLYARLFVYKFNIKQALSTLQTVKHGSKSTYDYFKCRCDQCTKANTKYSRQRSRKLKSQKDQSKTV